MKNYLVRQQQQLIECKSEKRIRKLRKLTSNIQQKLRQVLNYYVKSHSFSAKQIECLKLNLFLSAQKSKKKLEYELEYNLIQIKECTQKFDLICQVAQNKTFGKIVKRCPTCRSGQLQLEVEQVRYICQQSEHFQSIPQINCGLVFDFSEIEHTNWISIN